MAVAHASEVLPTPPLPVKNRWRVGARKSSVSVPAVNQASSDTPTSDASAARVG